MEAFETLDINPNKLFTELSSGFGAPSALVKKDWGFKLKLGTSKFQTNDLLFINKGGFCSKHIHMHSSNDLIVLAGELKILLYDDVNGVPAEEAHSVLSLTAGECYTIWLRTWHKFEAVEQCLVTEVTRVIQPELVVSSDIHRVSKGGINNG